MPCVRRSKANQAGPDVFEPDLDGAHKPNHHHKVLDSHLGRPMAMPELLFGSKVLAVQLWILSSQACWKPCTMGPAQGHHLPEWLRKDLLD